MISTLKEFLEGRLPDEKGGTSSEEPIALVKSHGRRFAQLRPRCQGSLGRAGHFPIYPAKGVSHER